MLKTPVSACWQMPCKAHLLLVCRTWTAAHQAPLSMGFSRPVHLSGFPFPSQEDLPTQGSNPSLLHGRQVLYQLSYQGSPKLRMSISYAKRVELSKTMYSLLFFMVSKFNLPQRKCIQPCQQRLIKTTFLLQVKHPTGLRTGSKFLPFFHQT